MFCVMKPKLMSNPVLSGQARLAGYVDGTSSNGLVKSCRDNLRAGGNLLIFPEGTRSSLGNPGPFKMGFAMIAKASTAPVQTLMIEISENYLGRGYSFLHQPTLPIQCTMRLGKRFMMDENEDPRSFGRRVEAYYQNSFQFQERGTPAGQTWDVAYHG
jgi:1-acyl-sn-glycerol-3-phosphate acyltransferase